MQDKASANGTTVTLTLRNTNITSRVSTAASYTETVTATADNKVVTLAAANAAANLSAGQAVTGNGITTTVTVVDGTSVTLNDAITTAEGETVDLTFTDTTLSKTETLLGTATHGAQSNVTAAFIDLFTATGATDIRTQPYRLVTLRNGSSILQGGQEPYFRNGVAMQNNKFEFTTLFDTAIAATNTLTQPGTVADATVQAVNNSVDHGDGTKTVTVTMDAKEYAAGKSQFDATSVLAMGDSTLHFQELALAGDGSGSSAANSIQTSESGIHLRRGDALSSGTVRQIRVVLTLAEALAAPLAKGATVSMHSGNATGTLTAAADMGASSLSVLVAVRRQTLRRLGQPVLWRSPNGGQ